MMTSGTISFRVARASRVLGGAGILPALFGMLPDGFDMNFAECRQQNAGGNGRNTRASQILVMSI
jgi:hypothetical protein